MTATLRDWRCLSLWQPWATAVAELLKGIETRSWATKYRGWLAIHAAQTVVYGSVGPYYVEPFFEQVNHVEDCYCEPDGITPECARRAGVRRPVLTEDERLVADLPLGAVVAVARLVDVVPMVADSEPIRTLEVAPQLRIVPMGGGRDHRLWLFDGGLTPSVNVDAELPWGDFRPGRYAWLLADVVKLPEPIPARGKQGLWKPDDNLVAQLEVATSMAA